jgi:hypothetical protein
MGSWLAVALTAQTTCTASAMGVTPVSGPLPRLEVGDSVEVCVEVRLSASAPVSVAGGSANFNIQLNAAQVR